MAKKATKKKVTKKATPKKAKNAKRGPGTPPGTKNHIPTGLEVRSHLPLQRAGSEVIRQGFKRVVLETVEEVFAVRLETLAGLVNKNDKKFLQFLDDNTPKSKKLK